jgi:BatD DUF11 like domain
MIKFLQKRFSKCFFFLVVIIAFGLINASFAQATFTVVCPQKKIGKNDVLQVQFMVNNASNVEAINPPSFKNFSIISGPNQQSGMSDINGKVNQYVAISYYLKPNAIGKFTIGPASAKADGKDFRSSPLNVEVTNASSSTSGSSNSMAGALSPFGNMNLDFSPEPARPQFDDYILKKGQNITDKVKKNLFVKLDVSKTSCFVGEPIIAAYKLYTRLRSESTITDAPSFDGFSVSDLDLNQNNSSTVEKYNGRDYNVYTLRKVQLYPLQAGTIALDPVVADNKVTFIKAEYADGQKGDMYLDMLQNFANATSPKDAVIEQQVTLQSKPVDIVVKPLPAENKPADFKGAVGSFTIDASLQKDNITTSDAGTLKIVIEGAGNIQLINAPKINWPEGIDGYEAKVTDGVDKFSVPMKGRKTFILPFTISKKGNYTIAPVSFSYFDPSSATYKTLSTQPLVVYVTPGSGNSSSPYLKNKFVQNPDDNDVIANYGVYFVAALALVLILFFLFYLRNNNKRKKAAKEKDTEEPEEELEMAEAFVIPESPLKLAHEKLVEGNSIGFYSVLDASFKKYLAWKFKVPAEELTKKRLIEELDKCNVGLGTSLRLSSLMEHIELNLYAPPPDTNQLREVYEKALEVVSLLDKQVC